MSVGVGKVLAFLVFHQIFVQCKTAPLLRKCCSEEQTLTLINNTANCIQEELPTLEKLPLKVTYYGKDCPKDTVSVPLKSEVFKFSLDEDSGEIMWKLNGTVYRFDHKKACVDVDHLDNTLNAIVCIEKKKFIGSAGRSFFFIY